MLTKNKQHQKNPPLETEEIDRIRSNWPNLRYYIKLTDSLFFFSCGYLMSIMYVCILVALSLSVNAI